MKSLLFVGVVVLSLSLVTSGCSPEVPVLRFNFSLETDIQVDSFGTGSDSKTGQNSTEALLQEGLYEIVCLEVFPDGSTEYDLSILELSIKRKADPDGDLPSDSDPLTEYQSFYQFTLLSNGSVFQINHPANEKRRVKDLKGTLLEQTLISPSPLLTSSISHQSLEFVANHPFSAAASSSKFPSNFAYSVSSDDADASEPTIKVMRLGVAKIIPKLSGRGLERMDNALREQLLSDFSAIDCASTSSARFRFRPRSKARLATAANSHTSHFDLLESQFEYHSPFPPLHPSSLSATVSTSAQLQIHSVHQNFAAVFSAQPPKSKNIGENEEETLSITSWMFTVRAKGKISAVSVSPHPNSRQVRSSSVSGNSPEFLSRLPVLNSTSNGSNAEVKGNSTEEESAFEQEYIDPTVTLVGIINAMKLANAEAVEVNATEMETNGTQRASAFVHLVLLLKTDNSSLAFVSSELNALFVPLANISEDSPAADRIKLTSRNRETLINALAQVGTTAAYQVLVDLILLPPGSLFSERTLVIQLFGQIPTVPNFVTEALSTVAMLPLDATSSQSHQQQNALKHRAFLALGTLSSKRGHCEKFASYAHSVLLRPAISEETVMALGFFDNDGSWPGNDYVNTAVLSAMNRQAFINTTFFSMSKS